MAKAVTTKRAPQGKDGILVISNRSSVEAATRGILGDSVDKVGGATLVASEKLATHLKDFGKQFSKALAAVEDATGRFQLDEVTVSLELTAEGQVAILGSGVSASGKSGLELTFKRSNC